MRNKYKALALLLARLCPTLFENKYVCMTLSF